MSSSPLPTFTKVIGMIASLAIASLAPAYSQAKTAMFEAKYVAEYTGIDIDITRSLSVLENNRYAYGLIADGGVASIRENSIFKIGETCLLPMDYYYRRKIMGFGGKEGLNFDWKNKVATYVKNRKKKAQHTLEIPIYDPALYQLQLQLDLHEKNQLTNKSSLYESSFEYRYMHKKKLRNREFKVIGKDTYTLQDKHYEALVLERVSVDPNKTTVIWVLPGLYHQIAYIRQTEDDDSQETALVSFEANHELLTKFYSDATLSSSPKDHTSAPSNE